MNDKQLKAVAMPGDFIFHSSWFEIFKSFDMATSYAIFMAMISYVQTGAVPADEELRRLTVFLFAHIDTDRQRILSLQPKRRSSAKKKPADTPDPKETPAHEATSDTSSTSDTSDTPTPPQSSQNFHPAPDGALTPRTRTDGVLTPRTRALNPLCGPLMQAARSEQYALRIAQATASLKSASRRSKAKRRR